MDFFHIPLSIEKIFLSLHRAVYSCDDDDDVLMIFSLSSPAYSSLKVVFTVSFNTIFATEIAQDASSMIQMMLVLCTGTNPNTTTYSQKLGKSVPK